MTLENSTGQAQSLSWCVADHWQEHGSHAPGAYDDCETKTTTVAPGACLVFDEAADNGPYIQAAATAAGLS